MKLIAESGSTKTDWRIIQSDKVIGLFSTRGINPVVQSISQIKDTQIESLSRFRDVSISEIDFYGAGCGMPESKLKIKSFIGAIFPYAEINVESDLVAASRAVFGDQEGVICILGTGSNSGYYNGNRIVERVPSLGYILGDEGGGVQIGKQILVDFLRNELPRNIQTYLISRLALSESEILKKVYDQKTPNSFMANLVSLLSNEFPANNYLNEIIRTQFHLFFNNCLLKYSAVNNTKIGFVGSIAYHYNEILNEVASDYSLIIHNIIKSPIDRLSSKKILEMDFINEEN